MRVFVSEYFLGGASPDRPSRSMLSEGMAMLKAAIHDISRLPDCVVVTTVDSGLSERLNCECIRVDSAEQEWTVFNSLLDQVDAALLIAPETRGILAERCRHVRKSSAVSWNCDPEAIDLCTDKYRLALHFQERGVPSISTQRACLEEPKRDFDWPVVLKPRDGAGSHLTFLIHDDFEWKATVGMIAGQTVGDEFILQPWIGGRSLSVGVVVGDSGRSVHCLEIGEQLISDDGRFRYLGGRIPADIPATISTSIHEVVCRACRTIPGLSGYIGIDLILKPDGTCVIVEINPRLTTSYVGYCKLYAKSLQSSWLSPTESISPSRCNSTPIEFHVPEFDVS